MQHELQEPIFNTTLTDILKLDGTIIHPPNELLEAVAELKRTHDKLVEALETVLDDGTIMKRTRDIVTAALAKGGK